MNTRATCLVVALGLLAGCGSLPDVQRSPSTPTLSAPGVGPVAFGAPLAESELLLGEKATGQDAGAACRYVEFGSLPGLRFTVVDDSVAALARAVASHLALGTAGVVVARPIDPADELPQPLYTQTLEAALAEANARGVRGRDVTPFLLERLSQLSEGASVASNRSLLLGNARLAAELAVELALTVGSAGSSGWSPGR